MFQSLLVLILLSISASVALADQSIVCREITPSGNLRADGGTVKLSLVFNQNGTISQRQSRASVTGFIRVRELAKSYKEIKIRSMNQGTAINGQDYATFFLDWSYLAFLDVQMQFDAKVSKREFRNLPGTLVIGSDDASPEYGWARGFRMSCNSYLR